MIGRGVCLRTEVAVGAVFEATKLHRPFDIISLHTASNADPKIIGVCDGRRSASSRCTNRRSIRIGNQEDRILIATLPTKLHNGNSILRLQCRNISLDTVLC